ncbi:DUF4435 domain-containing protein [Shewanella fidelis]|uniref:DUF4435 domain-containing protein n=1 Tax=Shewanella fidelis TaxID=173509 RepID=A0AAW8NH24_9GAMM|nr:DUF4435 domain-containing protein [Shewanella fidelis]MDR8522653.1 DUF4435 domain-containing protein [Shewanella fidelis]MDW4812269.1 DUF4435 domain-containing protein [Shewanella fidelis]MDW4816067.1 DUF4435 domain-containing protein [Shewanella fidelis]MDW4820510.1 DUF4435 domain-containing protein [Shewanella fidelis]MDW4824732.1 DUF4435 domain-containing protein [Shewanella fidelis]
MSSRRPTFTYQETLRSIKRRPDTKFVIVEGVDDVPAYCSIFQITVGSASSKQWEVFKADGKISVIDFLKSYSGDNVRFIVDKDFDQNSSKDQRLMTLGRYSIENYFICQDVLSNSLAVPLKLNPEEVKVDLPISTFLEEVNVEGAKLLKACFYYHKVIAPTIEGSKPSWSECDIHMKRTPESWGLCKKSISDIIEKLLPPPINWSEVNSYFDKSFNYSGQVAYDLPGKMLKEPLRRFARTYYRSKKQKGGTQFNTMDSFTGVVVANLASSEPFRDKINPIISFLKGEAA